MIVKNLLDTIRDMIRPRLPVLGGAAAMALLFLDGLVNNLSMSYMGNTSQAVVDFIMQNFLGFIVLFIVRVMAVYLAIGLLLGYLFHSALRGFQELAGRSVSRRSAFFISAGGTIIIALLAFMRDLVLYPQIYINNFYVKGRAVALLFDALTHHTRPSLYTVLLALIVTGAVALAIAGALRGKRFRFAALYALAVACVLVASALYYTTPSPSALRGSAPSAPNVLILGSDALRPDHFSGYGYFRDTTPHIDALISRGTSFTNAYIEVPRTFPSWVSILTGQFSATHGIRHMFPTSRDLNRDFGSIVKIFRERGYHTAVVGDYAGDIFTRIDLGFERVDTPYFNFNSVIQQAIIENHAFLLPFLTGKLGLRLFPVLRDSAYFCPPDLVRDRIIGQVERSGNKPFFIASFFSSTHFPYAPAHPYYLTYANRDYDGQYKYFKQRTISLEGESGYEKVTPRDIEQVRALYDGGLRSFDDAVGGIIDHLEKSGKLENTIVVVLSDHGENLYEGILGMGHGEHFRGSYSTKIPFIIHYPKSGAARREISGIVRHVDIAPTLLELAGQKTPARMEGVSLVPAIKGEAAPKLVAFGETGIWFDNSMRDELFFQKLRILYPDITGISEIDFHFDNQIVLNDGYRDLVNLAKHRYAHDGRYKLIYMPLPDRVEYELYDTKADPAELVNIAGKDPVNLARMKRILFDWVKRNNDVLIKNEFIFPLVRQ